MREFILHLKKVLHYRKKVDYYNITPQWFVGFFEAEGSFITINQKIAAIQITQHASDYNLLKAIQKFVGGGHIRFDTRKSLIAVYTCSNRKIISEKLFHYFDHFLVFQDKKEKYINWKKCNFDNSATLFLDKISKNGKNICGNWLCGFVDGDGSFHGITRKQKTYKHNVQLLVVFDLSQKKSENNIKDLLKINTLFFDNKCVLYTYKEMCHLKMYNITNHKNFIISFFSKYKLQSRKFLDFLIYVQMCNLILSKKHVTIQGLYTFNTYKIIQKKLRVYIFHNVLFLIKQSLNKTKNKHILP